MSTLPPDPATLERHMAFVRSVARAALAGDAEVEDVAQDAWVAALEGAPAHPRSLRAWLAAVTRRQAALRIRRRVRERRRVETVASRRRGAEARSESAADAVVRAETGRRLVAAVLALPEIHRSVLLLRYQDGLPPREVARQLAIPVETVRTRTRRGLEQLRLRLVEAERRRGADWRASLLLLVPEPSLGVSASAAAFTGVALMHKFLLGAVALLLLIGGALLWRPWQSDDAAHESADRSSLQASDAAREPATGDPQLAGRARTVASAAGDLAQPVDLAHVDRERDLHGTLVDDATDQPVAGALLTLTRRTWDRATSFDAGRWEERDVLGQGRSAADGTWRLRLEPGDVGDLTVRAAGHAEHRVRFAQAGERLDLRLQTGTALRVRVSDVRGNVLPGAAVRIFQVRGATRDGHGVATITGTTDAGGVFVAERLPRGVAVTIDVSHALHGAAMWHDARAPAQGRADVEITLPRSRVLTGRVTDARTGAPIPDARVGIGWTFDGAVRTDEAGWYELPGWPAQGVHEVVVQAEGYAQTVALVGKRTSIDFALLPQDRIRGRVVDARGRPMPGALVSAVGSSRETGHQVTSSGTNRADESGRFDVGGLRHDMGHRLVLVAPGHGRTLYDVPPSRSAGTVRDVGDLRLAAAGTIAGRLVRPDGAPLVRAAVLLEGGNANREALLEGHASLDHDYGMEEERYTDDLGRFRFRDVAPGRYALTVRIPGGLSLEETVELAAGTPRVRRTITVPEGRSFRVRVEDTRGDPVDQATVYVTTAGGQHASDSTDAGGRASFQLADAAASVRCMTEYALSGRRYIDPPETAVPADAEEIVLTVTPAEVIRGKVVDEQGDPLAGAALRAMRDGKALASHWTRADGTFRLTLPAGAVVDVELEGTRMEESGAGSIAKEAFLSGEVKGVRAGEAGVLIRARTVPHSGRITVRVTDPQGNPLSPAAVYVTRGAGGQVVTVAWVGADGTVALEGLPEAELHFAAARAAAAKGKDWAIPAPVRAAPRGQTLELAYRLGARVQGVVVDADGKRLAGARVEAAYEGGGYEVTTDANGRFDALVPAAAEDVTVRLLRPARPGAKAAAVKVRPGAKGIRLVCE